MTGHARLMISGSILASLLIGPAQAQDDLATITIPYSSAGGQSLGDGININFPSNPLSRCVTYEAGDVKWDTGGAINSRGTVEIITSYDQQKRDLDMELGYQTKSKVAAGGFSADAKFDISSKYSSMRNDEDTSLTVAFRAYADYGRRMVETYKADAALFALAASNLVEFRKRCGTHFIRGQRRFSDLTVLIDIDTSSRAGKDVLSMALESAIGGGMTMEGITGEGSQTIKSRYERILEFAKRSGKVRVNYTATGGPGIQAAGAAAVATDPADLKAFGTLISSVASLFSQDNSGVSGYVLLPNTVLGAPPADFDLERIRQLGGLTRHLIRINAALARFAEYRTKIPAFYQAYFVADETALNALRADIVVRINECAADAPCRPIEGDVLDDYVFIEDMFSEAELELSCGYQRASRLENRPTGSSLQEDPEILDTVAINAAGTVHHFDAIDFAALKINRVSPDFAVTNVTPGFSGFAFSNPGAGGTRRAFATIFKTNMRSADIVDYDSASGRYKLDEAELAKRREQVLGSAFVLEAPGPAGFATSYNAGHVPRRGCPLVRR